MYNDKWKNKDRHLKDSIIVMIENPSDDITYYDKMYYINVLKELERRGKIGIFKGHHKE
jgi:hypothetical protein